MNRDMGVTLPSSRSLGCDFFPARQGQRLSIRRSSLRYRRACMWLGSEAEIPISSLCRLGCTSCLAEAGDCANWEHRERG